jgi:membrane metallo-endopeptidase-like protein 1
VTLVDTDRMIVSELEYIRNVSLLVDQQPIRTVQNYMIWRFMMSQVQYMPKRFRAIRQTFNRVFAGVSTEPSRAVACANYVNDNMGLAVSKLYIRDNFDKTARNEVI